MNHSNDPKDACPPDRDRRGKVGGKINLIEVLPMAKNAGRAPLSYFSLAPVKSGQIVRVPLRRKEVPAVVISSRSVRDAKSVLRNASYSLKKIGKKSVIESFLPTHTITLANSLAEYYATSAGVILQEIFPKFLQDKPELLSPKKVSLGEVSAVTKEPLVLQMEEDERFGQYRSVIRQSFARGLSVVFIAPTSEEAEKACELLSKGINNYTFLLTAELKKKDRETTWQKAISLKHPVLFITTPFGLIFDRQDIGTYILERENSRSYRSLNRPFIHTRNLLLTLARITKRELIMGDTALSVETIQNGKNDKYGELSPVRWRLLGANTTLVDMKMTKSEDTEEERPFEVISPELRALMKRALEEKVGIFLYGARKGLSPTTICGDCGSILSCTSCGSPVVLHKRGEKSAYLCHRCGTKREPETRCDNCQSWKLNPIGIGTELIAKEAKKIFPLARITILDKDHANTRNKAEKIVQEFSEQGGILVGTELAVFHLKKAVYSGVVSIDALFSIPDFGAEERIFYLISRIREITEKETLIQTRNIGKEILAWSAQGNLIDFYKREIGERETYAYPPFTIFIKVEGKSVSELKVMFEKWHPEFTRESMIIRLARTDWPDKELSLKLSLLPPNFTVKVDPESLI